MKIKSKLAYSIGVLLLVIIFLGLFSSHNIRQMKKDTQNILVDNYKSVEYAQKMQSALNAFYGDSTSLEVFEQNLALQTHNITEPYEKEATATLVKLFQRFRQEPNTVHFIALSETINSIVLINISAISHKATIANKTADEALIFIVIFAVLSAVIAALMLLRFPRAFTKPIEELTEGIIEVSNGNYDNRLNFSSRSEFGKVALSFNSMAQQLSAFRSSSVARLIVAKRYLEIIINSIDEPVIGLDKNKIVLFANTAATTTLNLTREHIVGQSALDVSLTNDLFRRLMRGMELNSDKKDEPLKIYSDNKESYFQVHYTVAPEDSGTIIQLSNVTEFKELDNAKTNFISIISHELKTPISAILMSLKLLDDKRVGDMNDEQVALSQSIRENSDRLLSITGELLKMTQVEAGKLQLDPKITKPIELINYALNATRVLAEKFDCNIEVEYTEKLPKLFVDSEKIAWVVTNMLSNAIHHSPENSRIIIGAKEADRKIEIYVRDFGKGIDARYHKSIFDRYFRVPGTKIQGSGLGLAISKEFVEAHGGTMRVESAVGQGSCFIISFNLP